MGRNAQKRRSKKVKAALKGEGSVVDETDDVGARGPRAPEPPQAPLWLKQTVAADADSLAVTDDSLSATLVRIALRIAAASSLDEVARDVADIFGADAAVLVRVYPEEDRGAARAPRHRRRRRVRAERRGSGGDPRRRARRTRPRKPRDQDALRLARGGVAR